MPKKPKPPNRSGVRRGQGYVTIRGDTKAQARWKEGHRWRAKTFTAPTLDEAIDRAWEHIRIESRATLDPDNRDATVDDIAQAWLKRGRTRWSVATYANYRLLYETHVLPHLGRYRARDVTTARIQHWVDDLVASGLAPSSVRLIYIVGQGPFKEAARLGVIRDNPAQGITLPTIRRKPKPTWTVDHVQRVFAYLEGDPFWLAVYRFALTTGVRPGELIALRWADVDFEQGHATIARTLTRNERRQFVIGTDTKTHETRTVAVPASTLAALKVWRTRQIELRLASSFWLDDDLVFTATYGYHMDPRTWARTHRQMCDRAGVPRISLHGTRHSLATLMMAANTHPKVVSEILGHKSITTTLDIYGHVGIDLQKDAVTALDERFSGSKKARN